jgi:Reverse transcriptase (RNA-dependent DNA polymerase)
VGHHIETNGRPVFVKARHLEPAKRKVADEEFAALEKAGIVSRSTSPWASPLHMVPKKDGSWRPWGDYRRLNTITVPDRYPLPNLMDLSANMDSCMVFSKIDLVNAFHQVPIAPEDRKKTAVITPFGLFEYNYMPFGLCNAAQTLQRLQDNLFQDLPFVFVYLDDGRVASRNLDEHVDYLRAVFRILEDNGLAINLDKCEFAVPELDFLGHRLSAGSVTPLRDSLQVMLDFPRPHTVKDLQRFLVNFYHRFLPRIA